MGLRFGMHRGDKFGLQDRFCHRFRLLGLGLRLVSRIRISAHNLISLGLSRVTLRRFHYRFCPVNRLVR